MKFSLESSEFNNLLKRLLSLTGSDKDSRVIFLQTEKDGLEVYYNSSLEKGSNPSLFYEKVTVKSSEGVGLAAISAASLLSIKVPENAGTDRFPRCEEIFFSFTQSILNINYAIKWNKVSKDNVTKLNFALLEASTYNIEDISNVVHDLGKFIFSVNPKVISEAINLVNFIKTDATSKEANGCSLTTLPAESKFMMVTTDSNSAVKYEWTVDEISDKAVDLVVSNTILNSIRIFLPEEGKVKFYRRGNVLNILSENRKMTVPTMANSFLIQNPKEFFEAKTPLNSELDLKPFITTALSFVSKSCDVYKRIRVSCKGEDLSLQCAGDKSNNLPAKNSKNCEFDINGSLLTGCAQKLLSLDLTCSLFYNDQQNRLLLSSEDGKLICLIQCLSL